MTLKRMIFSAVLALGIVTLAADPALAQSAARQLPGFGSDTRPPEGAPFILPAGLEIAGPIMGADDDGNCPKPRTRTIGSGLDVRACIPIRNRTGGGITVIFPPGLVIVSASEGFQNGLLVEREVVTIPPTAIGGPGKLRDKDEFDVIYVPLHTYCLNKPREIPTPNSQFRIGPITSHSGLSELYAFMVGKDFKNDGERVEVLQEIVWEVIKDGRFTAQHRKDLNEIWAKPDLH